MATASNTRACSELAEGLWVGRRTVVFHFYSAFLSRSVPSKQNKFRVVLYARYFPRIGMVGVGLVELLGAPFFKM